MILNDSKHDSKFYLNHVDPLNLSVHRGNMIPRGLKSSSNWASILPMVRKQRSEELQPGSWPHNYMMMVRGYCEAVTEQNDTSPGEGAHQSGYTTCREVYK